VRSVAGSTWSDGHRMISIVSSVRLARFPAATFIATRRQPACLRLAPRLGGRRRDLRQPWFASFDALQPKSRLSHRDAAEAGLSIVERAERDVALARRRDIS
jgi:hypothetical protein